MTLFVIGLILYFGGKWLSARIDTTMPHLCRTCLQKYYGDACPRCEGEAMLDASGSLKCYEPLAKTSADYRHQQRPK